MLDQVPDGAETPVESFLLQYVDFSWVTRVLDEPWLRRAAVFDEEPEYWLGRIIVHERLGGSRVVDSILVAQGDRIESGTTGRAAEVGVGLAMLGRRQEALDVLERGIAYHHEGPDRFTEGDISMRLLEGLIRAGAYDRVIEELEWLLDTSPGKTRRGTERWPVGGYHFDVRLVLGLHRSGLVSFSVTGFGHRPVASFLLAAFRARVSRL